MHLKVKVGDDKNLSRIEANVIIKEVRIRENLINEKDEIIELCFKDGPASGILELKKDELTELNQQVRKALERVRVKQEDKYINDDASSEP
ncbi:MAG: hypothetical protein V1725_06695 [archaeon]